MTHDGAGEEHDPSRDQAHRPEQPPLETSFQNNPSIHPPINPMRTSNS